MNLSLPFQPISFLAHPTPIPAWRVSRGERDSFHRFFDSSAVSPSGRYLVYHEIDRRNISTLSHSSQAMDIVVADLFTGDHSVVESSLAWAAQLGAQAQWSLTHTHTTTAATLEGNEGDRVDFLYYNRLNTSRCSAQDTHTERCSENGEERVHVRGVRLSFPKGERREYPCAIYHVSADGRYSASVDLLSIGRTQKGYGVDWVAEEMTSLSGGEDGIFVNNLHTGQCVMLYSMREIAASVGIDLDKKKLFGFHTKWSTDGKRILFVMRSIEEGIRSQSKRQHRRHTSRTGVKARHESEGEDVSLAKRMSNALVDVFLPAPRVRVQHLFVLFTEFVDDISFTLKERRVKYVLSWASKPFRYQFPVNSSSPAITANCDKRSCSVVLRDGNHPNWIPHSHSISMNFEADSSTKTQRECETPIEHQEQPDNQMQSETTQSIFQVVRIDTDTVPHNLPIFHRSFEFTSPTICENRLIHDGRSKEQNPPLTGAVKVDVVWPFGSGHPSIHSSGRWIIIDEYAKEAALKTKNGQIISNEVINASLWLVDLMKHKVAVQIKVPITEYSPSEGLVADLQKFIGGEKEDRSWRCDLHPTWDPNGQQIIVNYWNATSHSRQVALINLQSFLGA